MKMGAKFEVKNETFGASFEQTDSTFDADFSNVGGGQDGKDGATFIPSVSKEGVISWTNNGNLPNPTPVNIKGEKGEKGERGLQGVQGERGEQGIQGEQGEKGADGTNGKDGINGKDGYTPIKGVDYFDGKDGKDGADGKDGNDYILTEEDKSEIVDDVLAELPELPSGSSKAIIDVVELPAENIDEDSIHRIPIGTFYAGLNRLPWVFNAVEELPSEGVPAMPDFNDPMNATLYYETTTKSVSGYVDEAMSGIVGISVGWYPIEILITLFESEWGGIVYDEANIPSDRFSMLLEYELYQCKDGVWDKIGGKVVTVGRFGDAIGAEEFNHPDNIASGDYSHAEGWQTRATGSAAHAEGESTVAEGPVSHAEGLTTMARGNGSHSEGKDTAANGDGSHVEGHWTIANGENQHVQGRFNIEDPENKYAHIVGNGDGTARSNAHTLDWQGNAWFQGKVKVGGTGQDDPEAKTLATTEYVDNNLGTSLTVSNLIGTTWKVPSGWVESGSYEKYDMQGQCIVEGITVNVTHWFCIGGGADPDNQRLTSKANTISIVSADDEVTYEFDNSSSFVLTIVGGLVDDMTNSYLIKWLNTYGRISHVDLSEYQRRTDNLLETESKEVVGAINELNRKIPKESIVGTWKLNGAIAPSSKDFRVHFTNNGEEYYAMEFGQDGYLYYSVEMTDYSMEVYDNNGWLDDLYRTIEILEEPTDAEFITWLKANATKQVVDLSNFATVDKVEVFTLNEGAMEIIFADEESGVAWNQTFGFYDADDNCLKNGIVVQQIPLVAGNNVEFEVDDENQVVKINATGGGTPDNVVMNYKVEVESSTTVADMIATIQGMGADISKFNVVTLYGYQSATLGMQINHYGGNVYNINAIDLMIGNTLSNTADWSEVGVGNFIVMFKGAIPYCDSSNEGQVLMVVNGVPTWTTL